jgi:hypothetical protein
MTRLRRPLLLASIAAFALTLGACDTQSTADSEDVSVPPADDPELCEQFIERPDEADEFCLFRGADCGSVYSGEDGAATPSDGCEGNSGPDCQTVEQRRSTVSQCILDAFTNSTSASFQFHHAPDDDGFEATDYYVLPTGELLEVDVTYLTRTGLPLVRDAPDVSSCVELEGGTDRWNCILAAIAGAEPVTSCEASCFSTSLE